MSRPLLAEDQLAAPPPPPPDWRALLRAAVACLEAAASSAPDGHRPSLLALTASARACAASGESPEGRGGSSVAAGPAPSRSPAGGSR